MSKRRGKSKLSLSDNANSVTEQSETSTNRRFTRSALKLAPPSIRLADERSTTESQPSYNSTSADEPEPFTPRFQLPADYQDKITNNHLSPEEEVKCRAAAEEYIANCRHFHVNIDPSVVIALQTGWTVLQPSSRFTEGSMLPLKNILEESDMITKLNLSNVGMQDSRFRAAGNGNANARILNFVLQKNHWIKELDLSNTGLDDDGVREISEGLKENNSIEKLNLARNHFGIIGTNYLNDALKTNKSIHDLDLSSNALGYHSINSLLCVCGPRNINVITQGNYVFEEILNSVSHGVAFLGAIVGANILIADTTDIYHTDYHFWAAVIYSFALLFLFLSSCLFHSFFMLPSSKFSLVLRFLICLNFFLSLLAMRILQILDHVGIYLVIAGTYTPFLMGTLHKYTSASVLLIFEWIAAFLGGTFASKELR
jgi:predicted membrane channel-forming protein YqfA (hemolysin III family)